MCRGGTLHLVDEKSFKQRTQARPGRGSREAADLEEDIPEFWPADTLFDSIICISMNRSRGRFNDENAVAFLCAELERIPLLEADRCAAPHPRRAQGVAASAQRRQVPMQLKVLHPKLCCGADAPTCSRECFKSLDVFR